jgi:hypothetical protein
MALSFSGGKPLPSDGLSERGGGEVLQLARGQDDDVGQAAERFEAAGLDNGGLNLAVEILGHCIADYFKLGTNPFYLQDEIMKNSIPRFFGLCFFLLAGLFFSVSPVHAEVHAGDILVVDSLMGTNERGALLVVNPKTGQRRILSDFGNPAQGSLSVGGSLMSVAVSSGGQIFVSDLFNESFSGGVLFGIDPDTGHRTIISDFAQGDIRGHLLIGLDVDAFGRVIATLDQSTESETKFLVVRINPKTDQRVIVSDLTNSEQGGIAKHITDLTIKRSGKILICTDDDLDKRDSKIFGVYPVTGKRELISDFANPLQGTDIGEFMSQPGGPAGIAEDAAGRILVAAGFSWLPIAPRNLLFRINPKTGQRTVLSDFDNPAQGPLGWFLTGVARRDTGQILVLARDTVSGLGLIFRVNPFTGRRSILSDMSDPAQGPLGSVVVQTSIAVVPKSRSFPP